MVSILTINPIAKLFNFLGRDPQHSMKLFVRGLGLFVLGLIFIAVGNMNHHLWQVPGLFFLAFGILLAAWGYLGVFVHRMQRMLTKRKPPQTKF